MHSILDQRSNVIKAEADGSATSDTRHDYTRRSKVLDVFLPERSDASR